jgi:hypothetical protein
MQRWGIGAALKAEEDGAGVEGEGVVDAAGVVTDKKVGRGASGVWIYETICDALVLADCTKLGVYELGIRL